MMQRIFLTLSAALLCFGAPANFLLATDFFVTNQGAPSGGTGTALDPFGTITEAVTAGGYAPADRILVAAGTYDAAGGETFPIPLVDGVALVGAAGNTTIVDGTGAGADCFGASTVASPTTLSGFYVIPDMDWDGVNLSASTTDVDLRILNNIFDGGHGVGDRGLDFDVYGTGWVVDILVQGNQFIGMEQIGADLDVSTTAAGSFNLTVVSNTFLNGDEGLDVYVGGGGTANVYLNDNTFMFLTDNACDVFIGPNTVATSLAVDFEFNRNYIDIIDDNGLELDFRAAATNAFISGMAWVQSNSVLNCTDNGMDVDFGVSSGGSLSMSANFTGNVVSVMRDDRCLRFAVSASSSGTASVVLVASCNRFALADEDGMELRVSEWNGSGSAILDATLRYNEFVDNFNRGLEIDVYQSNSGLASLNLVAHGNVIMGNLESGIDVSGSTGAGTLNLSIDFGGGAAVVQGRNTIQDNFRGNDPNDFDLDVSDSSFSSLTFDFTGNWWGTTSLAAIESNIRHQVDSATNALVDFSGPLGDPLVFTAVGAGVPGAPMTLTADANTPFVPKAGQTPIVVTVGGIPAGAVNVAADGSTLTFTAPIGIVGGSLPVTVINPGGQLGVLIAIFAFGGNSGGCFVATASYGDENANEVRLLRQWRDECLADNVVGRHFVRGYYAVAPALADVIRDKPALQAVSRAALAPVVGAARLWMEMPWAYALAGAALMFRLLRRKP